MNFVAISRVTYPAHLKKKIHAVGLEMLPVAREQPGFISIAFHESLENDETLMYWEWESKLNHESCMQSAAWNCIMEKHGELFAQEGVTFAIETYERLA